MNSGTPDEMGKSLFIMVGDPSADRNVARAIPELKRAAPDLHIWGCGGSMMQAQGVEILHNCEDFTVVGITEIVKQFGFFVKLGEEIIENIKKRKPSAVMLVDMGVFNLKLAKKLHTEFPDLKILYFTSPQVWASRPWRIKTIAQNVTKMLVIFPFEVAIYRKNSVPVQFMGHPLLRNIPAPEEMPTKQQFCEKYKMNPDKSVIAVFAGSRKREVKHFMPALANAIKTLATEGYDLQFAFSAANERLKEQTEEALRASNLGDEIGKRIFIVGKEDNLSLMNICDFAWAKSGTTTLEVTLFGKPMLIFYRVAWYEYALYCTFKTLNLGGMPNILAGYRVVPELIQLDCRGEQLVKYTRDLINVPGLRTDVSRKLLTLRDQLGKGDYAQNLAEEILAVI